MNEGFTPKIVSNNPGEKPKEEDESIENFVGIEKLKGAEGGLPEGIYALSAGEKKTIDDKILNPNGLGFGAFKIKDNEGGPDILEKVHEFLNEPDEENRKTAQDELVSMLEAA